MNYLRNYLDKTGTFDRNVVAQLEQQRRLRIIQPVADDPFHYQRWRNRAAETLVEYPVFAAWCIAYRQGEAEALTPELEQLTPKEQQKVVRSLKKLGPAINKDVITDDDIRGIAVRNGWKKRRARNWLRRFCTAGPWGFTGRFNPLKPAPRNPEREGDLGGLSEKDWLDILKKYSYIQPLLEHTTDEKVELRVEELNEAGVKKSMKTLYNYLKAYRKYGLIGLKRKTRSDKGKSRYLSEELAKIIRSLRISNNPSNPKEKRYITVESVWERACEIARNRGEQEPSKSKVRQIIGEIPRPLLQVADGRRDKFRSESRVTGPIVIPEDQIIIQIDTTLVNVLIIDTRPQKGRPPKKKPKVKAVRMYIIDGIDMNSRRAFPPKLVYDRPDRFTVGAYIRQLVLEIGLPDEIWTDRGKEYIAKHVKRAAAEIGLEMIELPPNSPQVKGKIERLFETFDTRVWKSLPGYTGRNLSERPPNVEPALTSEELLEAQLKFNEKYNNEIHSETGVTPNEYWEKHYCTLPVDPADLDIFLEKTGSSKVQKRGVPYNGNYYWHDEIYKLIGQYVEIRADPYEQHPQEIVVYHQGKRFGTARLEPPRRKVLGNAQRAQMGDINQEVSEANRVIAELAESADEKLGASSTPLSNGHKTARKQITPASRRRKTRKVKKDPWEGMPD